MSRRQKRIKVRGKNAGQHVVSRTVHREFLFDDHMKGFFEGLLWRFTWLYEVTLHGWVILENHYHIALTCKSPKDVNAEKAVKRWNRYHRDKHQKNASCPEDRAYVVDCLTDISHFMKKLNTLMTREYNRRTGHTGTLWEGRYRSTVVEHGRAMLMTAAYIELNSFRASIVGRPEDYKYSSLYHLKKGNQNDVIDAASLGRWLNAGEYPDNTERKRRGSNKKNSSEEHYITRLYRKYLEYIYERGSRAPRRKLKRGRADSIKITEQMQKRLDEKLGSRHGQESRGTGELTKGAGLCRRIWTFTRGKFIGSRKFAGAFYGAHMDPGYEKNSLLRRHKKKWINGMSGGLWGVFNGSRRRREEKEWEEAREPEQAERNGNGKNGRGAGNNEKGKWIGGGQRGSPPS